MPYSLPIRDRTEVSDKQIGRDSAVGYESDTENDTEADRQYENEMVNISIDRVINNKEKVSRVFCLF